MIGIRHNDISVDAEPFEDRLPPGIVAEREAPEAGDAARAVRALERIVEEACAETAGAARYAQLQSFPRLGGGSVSGFSVRDHLRDLCPDWYGEVLDGLTEEESEVFLKNYLVAHEVWGHEAGVGALVKSLIESAAHDEVPVAVAPVGAENRSIPAPERSRLGRKDAYSMLGESLVLGREFQCRSRRYEIVAGPITRRCLETLCSAGWAAGEEASERLTRLLGVAEPYYLAGRVRFVLETEGFELARAVLGRNTLGGGTSQAVVSAA